MLDFAGSNETGCVGMPPALKEPPEFKIFTAKRLTQHLANELWDLDYLELLDEALAKWKGDSLSGALCLCTMTMGGGGARCLPVAYPTMEEVTMEVNGDEAIQAMRALMIGDDTLLDAVFGRKMSDLIRAQCVDKIASRLVEDEL